MRSSAGWGNGVSLWACCGPEGWTQDSPLDQCVQEGWGWWQQTAKDRLKLLFPSEGATGTQPHSPEAVGGLLLL